MLHITLRAKKYIKNKLGGMNNYQSALKAGYSMNTAKNASKNIENHGVRYLLDEAVSDELDGVVIAKALLAGIHAKKVINLDDRLVEVEDHRTQIKFVQLALKVKGYI